jgi:hypothetical protein
MARRHLAAALLTGLLGATTSQAASVSFYLDQSNRLPDGVNYLQVTVADGASGAIDFTVTALQPLLAVVDDNFGIDRFAFNVVGGTATDRRDVTDLPNRWRAQNGGGMDGFGLFDIRVISRGRRQAQESLTFSITGVDLDTVLSYVDLSTGRAVQGFSLFSAHVIGLDPDWCEPTVAGSCVRQAFFGGSTIVDPVPAPPAIWLLGTALAGLAARRLRRS